MKAFTLIELLVVISIIGLLASIVLVGLEGGEESAITSKAMSFSHTVRVSLGADLVGEWKFDDTVNPAIDSSGGGNSGNLLPDGSEPVYVNGIFGKALEFNGANYVEVTDNIGLSNIKEAITVSYWVKRTISSGGYHILKKDAFGGLKDTGGNNFGFWTSHIGGTEYLSFVTDKISLNEFHYITLTWQPGNKKIYIDAELAIKKEDSRNDYLLQSGSNSIFIGNSQGWHANNFSGILDEVQIYNRALSMAEIQQLYAEGAARHGLVLK
ncbi:MAG: LamG-like jellyroll fold domain-containing protein [bacterium]